MILEIGVTVALCRTVIENVIGVPEQPPTLGVTTTVAVTSALPLLLAINAGIFPEPDVPKPILVEEVQSKVAPAEGLEKVMVEADASSQYVTLDTWLTVELVGLTVTVND